jgi:hypothetical protein
VDTLVVNTCGTLETFDANVGLDPQWQTIPNNNPGNATFTYTTAGEVDPSTFTSGGQQFPLSASLFNAGSSCGTLLPAGQSCRIWSRNAARRSRLSEQCHTGIRRFLPRYGSQCNYEWNHCWKSVPPILQLLLCRTRFTEVPDLWAGWFRFAIQIRNASPDGVRTGVFLRAWRLTVDSLQSERRIF